MVAEKSSNSDYDGESNNSNNKDNNQNSKIKTNKANYGKNGKNGKNVKNVNSGKNDKNGRIITKSLLPDNSNNISIWSRVFVLLSALILIIVAYFAWFFEKQNELLRKQVSQMQTQLNIDLKDRLSSANIFERKIQSSFDKINADVRGELARYQKENMNLSYSVKLNSDKIKQQQLILSSPDGAISKIKHDAHLLMLGSLVNNINQALFVNQISLVRELWSGNYSGLLTDYPDHKSQITQINDIVNSLSIPNDSQLISVLGELNNSIYKLNIIDVKSSYNKNAFDHKLDNNSGNKLEHKLENKKANKGWWARQKESSQKYAGNIWKYIKDSFVVSDNKKSPLLITQGDRVDAYRVIKQSIMQMQWAVISNNNSVFNETKQSLIKFVDTNMVNDSASKSWISNLNLLNLPDQSIKTKHLREDLASLYKSIS